MIMFIVRILSREQCIRGKLTTIGGLGRPKAQIPQFEVMLNAVLKSISSGLEKPINSLPVDPKTYRFKGQTL